VLPTAPTAPDPVRSLPRTPDSPPASPLPELFTPFLRAAAGLWLLLVVVVAQSLHGRLSDPDLWWHLKTGAVIAATRHVPHVDPYSYSAAGKPWTAHEWLSELVLYGLWRAGGFAAILWFRALMVAAIVAAMYFALRHRSGSYIAAIFLALGWRWPPPLSGASDRTSSPISSSHCCSRFCSRRLRAGAAASGSFRPSCWSGPTCTAATSPPFC